MGIIHKMLINMKLFFAILFVCLACSDDDESSNIGCQTGIPKGSTDRVLIRCSTQQEHLAGNNVNAGGLSTFTNYTQHQWAKCGDCK
jgi:hypothetical protein